jgi:3D (Asp-Asp-Asp) domain-containing protein
MAAQTWWHKNYKVVCLNTVLATLISFASVTTSSCFKSPVGPLQREIETHKSMSMTVTAYHTKGTPATLKKQIVGRDAAVSRDRIDLLGKKVYVLCPDNPVGVREVTDLTAERLENTLDILVPDNKTAINFGTNQCQVIPLDN